VAAMPKRAKARSTDSELTVAGSDDEEGEPTAPRGRVLDAKGDKIGKGGIEEGVPGKDAAHEEFTKMFVTFMKSLDREAKIYVLNMTSDEIQEMRDKASARLEDEITLYGKPTPSGYVPGQLRKAAITGDAAKVSELLKASLNPNYILEQVNGCTPLHEAAKAGHANIVQNLLDHEGNAKHNNKLRETPLMHACFWGRKDCIEILHKAAPGYKPDAVVAHEHDEEAELEWNSPGVATVLCSVPEFSNGDHGFEVLRAAQTLCSSPRYSDRITFGYKVSVHIP
jgi:hypothetical protein